MACEVASWCPVEKSISLPSSTVAVLENTKYFRLHIRNNVQFPKFNLDWEFTGNYTINDVVEETIKKNSKTVLTD